MRFSTSSYNNDKVNLEIGIAMGCTISPILFVMAMEVTLKAAEDSAGPPNRGGIPQIWHMAPLRISFLIRSVYDLLPYSKFSKAGKERGPDLSAMASQRDQKACHGLLQNHPLTGTIPVPSVWKAC
ncbi:hypothetical protein RRG08_054555 [Elysia crispata]|uniref:Uncharacterized protein n=1 Tax=Elysia crispata TaxID=231223 RepID=A0AAE1B1C5_9GAST|nr:hypothetical protein RRG08_054555 [Elysia crispata]